MSVPVAPSKVTVLEMGPECRLLRASANDRIGVVDREANELLLGARRVAVRLGGRADHLEGVDACVPAVRRIGHPARQRSFEALLTAAYQHRAV